MTGMPIKGRRSLIAALALGLTAPFVLRQFAPVGRRIGMTPVVRGILDDPDTPRHDPPEADITMAVFTDYQCPACRASNPAMQAALAEDRHVRILFKDWPVFGARSERAARLAIAADRQSRYAPFHDALMRTPGLLDEEALRQAAHRAGLDWERLEGDAARDRVRSDRLLARNATQAWSLGLQGTPGYLIGPLLVEGRQSKAGFRKAFAEARQT